MRWQVFQLCAFHFGPYELSPWSMGERAMDYDHRRCFQLKKKAFTIAHEGFIIKDSQRLTLPGVILVPSALVGLTALFGMGRGDPHRYSHLKIFKSIVHRPLSMAVCAMDY